MFPEYNKIGSAISALLESNNHLNMSTESLTTFSFKTVDIKVVSAPDKVIFKLVLVRSVSSVKVGVATKKGEAVQVVLDPETDDVKLKLLSVIFTGVAKPIDNK